jgi:hypothetical protein
VLLVTEYRLGLLVIKKRYKYTAVTICSFLVLMLDDFFGITFFRFCIICLLE